MMFSIIDSANPKRSHFAKSNKKSNAKTQQSVIPNLGMRKKNQSVQVFHEDAFSGISNQYGCSLKLLSQVFFAINSSIPA